MTAQSTWAVKVLPMPIALFYWWYVLKPKELLAIFEKLLKKELSFFSMDLLLKTLFLPWKRDEINTDNMSLQDKGRILLMNLVSRLVGAVVRSGTIAVGITALIATMLGAFVLMTVFLALPILSVVLIISAFSGR